MVLGWKTRLALECVRALIGGGSEEICVWVFSLGVCGCGLWGWVFAGDGSCGCSAAFCGVCGFAGWGGEDDAALACGGSGGFGG